MTIIARATVTEDYGIRRFLYPLQFNLPYKKSDAIEIAATDEHGNLLPCEAYRSRNKINVHFAVSLGPYEKRKLTFFTSDEKTPIPDPITGELYEDGRIENRQERLVTTITNSSELSSVIYDGVEHLAGPVIFTLNAEKPVDELTRIKSSGGELAFQTSAWRHYPANERLCRTDIHLTACKSWAEIVHSIDSPAPGSVISLDIPLTPPGVDEVPTCDFGLGNGIYSKIDGDETLFEADFYGKKPYCCWQISRLTEGIQRIDYQGDALTVKALAQSLYFHWNLPNRALAVAVTELPPTTTHVQALLGRNGRIHISIVLGDIPLRTARFGAVLHFLNDTPAIAAATNPASILCVPKVAVRI